MINNIIDDADGVIQMSEDSIEEQVCDEVLNYGLEIVGYKTINEIDVIIIEVPEEKKISIKELKQICLIVKQNYPTIEPLFMFSKINGMKRKSIIQANLSFAVKGRELHVMNWGKEK